ncbi:MAG: transketolase, partial [Planctomycetales bacterium]|nr:transketolase [Planctomycetales bacterium]
FGGRNLHFGIREHAMAAACNGLSLSGIRPYCATFFVFSDYLRPSLRLSSIMHQGVLYVLTHDSIGLGEDGPTHQPVEHLAACRGIPGVRVYRPSDANEVSEAYRAAISDQHHPSVLVLTRQNLPTLDRSKYGAVEGTSKGGYVLAGDPKAAPQVILVATGSEVPIALEAHDQLTAEGIASRVVSMVSCELFDAQDKAYRDSVLPPSCKARVGVEAGIRQGWDKYIGSEGEFVGMSSFGASAPFQELYEHFGITPNGVAAAAKRSIAAQ